MFLNKIIDNFEIDVFLVLIFCSLALSSLGVFLVLKKVSMVIDAISHSVLLGIVLAFLIFQDLNSPFLIIGAASVGVLTVYLVDLIFKNTKISKDSAIGITFTFFFSIAIIIISLWTRDVHIDTDAVFLGNIELTHIRQLYKIIPILITNIIFVIIFYKELKIFIFDPSLTNILGFSSCIINYILMTLSSITTVIAFDLVGSVMTIICMIGPAAISILLTKNLFNCWCLSLWISFVSSSLGYFLGIIWDLPVSGLISVIILILFLLVLFLEPKRGIIAKFIQQNIQKKNFMIITLLMHIENNNAKNKKNIIQEIKYDLNWSYSCFKKCIKKAQKENLIKNKNKELMLTNLGKKFLYKKNKDFGLI
ncbi:iron chelate uptake ABC transporter family permease subunit [Texas Phoenix palm phytoplasma]|uniref:Iron chelate uptake ABC transporter family permease subunit n=1 Tax=Texas Phoenix palm phytoplasma TaxID=176709 RepID=A0ABS5BI88_9MOLU|nr:metal ABC transporter permease [Texas Phoenix palm phytoplasma]MBP3059264.1 iron chelate uptake ABC transporter family permease subunit [Texas Phoenix palm phytoplasma]